MVASAPAMWRLTLLARPALAPEVKVTRPRVNQWLAIGVEAGGGEQTEAGCGGDCARCAEGGFVEVDRAAGDRPDRRRSRTGKAALGLL
jgi:hypothetical protein